MAFNGGSYTGAIVFTGTMYIGAAVFLWLVRAWKIGQLEEEAAAEGKTQGDIDPVTEGEDHHRGPDGFKRSPFLKRMFMWLKV